MGAPNESIDITGIIPPEGDAGKITYENFTVGGIKGRALGIRLNEINPGRLENLRALCQAKIDANESFADAVKVVAEKANIQPAALSAYVTALVKDTLEKTQAKADQLSLLFEELGE